MKLHIAEQEVTLNEGGYIKIKFDVVGEAVASEPIIVDAEVEEPKLGSKKRK